ncbi:MAG TPA: hypothetical protein VE596_17260 [Gaiellaceae bacterium]|nr:hypothetical protein [Gaiellaceae bacterium]
MAEPETCAICEKHRGEGPLELGDLPVRGDAAVSDPAEVARYCARLREALG